MKDLKYIVISSGRQVKKCIDLNPSPQLVKLLREGCDGGRGEFEKELPAILRSDNDASFIPILSSSTEKGVVIWERIF